MILIIWSIAAFQWVLALSSGKAQLFPFLSRQEREWPVPCSVPVCVYFDPISGHKSKLLEVDKGGKQAQVSVKPQVPSLSQASQDNQVHPWPGLWLRVVLDSIFNRLSCSVLHRGTKKYPDDLHLFLIPQQCHQPKHLDCVQ